MNLQEVSKFLIPVLVVVLALAMADEGVHDPSLYQFLDFTRVEQSQKHEGHRPFRWLNKFRRKSQVPVRSHSETTPTKEQQGSQIPINYVIEDVSSQYQPQPTYHQPLPHQRESAKKPKDTSYIILPPPPAGQAKQINIPSHAVYHKQQKKSKMPFVGAYKQRQQANKPLQPPPSPNPDYKQQAGVVDYNFQKPSSKPQVNPDVSSSQQAPNYESNVPLVSNDGSHSGGDSTPTHVGFRYSKWLSKMRRKKTNQPEKLENQQPKPHEKPSENVFAEKEPLYYFQNPSPNNQLQPVSYQSAGSPVNANGHSQPQTVNSGSQLAPPRPVNTRPSELTNSSPSPASFRPEAFPTVALNAAPQESSPDSGETADQSPTPNRKSFYSKFMKKFKRNKGHKHEETESEEEPVSPPLQTPYKPQVEPVAYRPPQPTNYPPQPIPARPPNVKPSRPAGPAPYSPVTVSPVFNPPAPAYQDAPAPTTYSPLQNLYNKFSPRPTYSTTEKPVAYAPPSQEDSFFSPPNKPDFIPSPFHGQSEKGQGIHEDPEEGFFEFGIFPKNNGFFEQNFKG